MTSATAKKKSSPLALAALFTLILVVIYFSFHFWSEGHAAGSPPFPKYALVLWVGALTAIEAYLVMRVSMHLQHEKKLVVGIAVLPFITVLLAIFPILIDILTLKNHGETYNIVHTLGQYSPHHASEMKAGEEGNKVDNAALTHETPADKAEVKDAVKDAEQTPASNPAVVPDKAGGKPEE